MSILHFGMLYQLDVFTFYFSEPLLFQIFFLLEIYKNLGLPLSTVTFTVNSHADNHFYKYISFFQILYSMKVFLIKMHINPIPAKGGGAWVGVKLPPAQTL